MNICEFCLRYSLERGCDIGLKIPKGMNCREFAPGLEKFCADPKDFVDSRQIVEMATHFGIQKTELKKVKIIAQQGLSGEASRKESSQLN